MTTTTLTPPATHQKAMLTATEHHLPASVPAAPVSASEAMALEDQYGAHNYHPLPVVLTRGKGVKVWDMDGKEYYDFLSAYSAVNQGHCHPAIIEALVKQAQVLTLTSRAFFNDQLGRCEQYLCELFGYQKALMMNTGVEANEPALKVARKWGYQVKGIPQDQAIIVAVERNFHGRTMGIVSASTDETARKDFGPFMPGYNVIPYDDIAALEVALQNPNVCCFWVEPIQGEAGVFVPHEGYLLRAFELCEQYNVLFVADEVQTGIARTGKLIACHHEGVQPHVLILGKALSGGAYPVSCVLANDDVLGLLKPGQHGSTFGGNPLACAVAMAAMQVVVDEDLSANAHRQGEKFRARLTQIQERCGFVTTVRGKGLLNAVIIKPLEDGRTAWEVCMKLMENGLLAKPTHGDIIRFAPPLVINDKEMEESLQIIDDTLSNFV